MTPDTTSRAPDVSIVVVAHDMGRELPRTLASLAPPHQLGLEELTVEIVVVDNGSAVPVDPALVAGHPGPSRLIRVDPAPPSPAAAANQGIAAARGRLVGLIVDGARMASPGLVRHAVLASRLDDRAVIATAGYHLGDSTHMDAAGSGYDQTAEDRLLDDIGWPADGYRLFEISTLAASSGRGWFGPMGESSALFLSATLWAELGGLDERFALPGGGLVNHDLYRRACGLAGSTLVVVLGEGTFHQIHGGAATSRRFTWEEMHQDYVRITGADHRPPDRAPVYVGSVTGPALRHLEESVRLAVRRRDRDRR